MKLLPSVCRSLNSRMKIFVFVANSRRHFSIFMLFNEGLEEKTTNSEVILAVCRLTKGHVTSSLISLIPTCPSCAIVSTCCLGLWEIIMRVPLKTTLQMTRSSSQLFTGIYLTHSLLLQTPSRMHRLTSLSSASRRECSSASRVAMAFSRSGCLGYKLYIFVCNVPRFLLSSSGSVETGNLLCSRYQACTQ